MTAELYYNVMEKVLDAAGVTYFTAREVCNVGRETKQGNRVVRLQPPPSSLFKNIVETARVAQWLREQVGPITIVSGYRDPVYNAAVGGEDHSLHMEFNALDIQAKNVTPRELAILASKHQFARKMGIGLYPTFVHIDTRGMIGRLAPARWPQADWRKIEARKAA